MSDEKSMSLRWVQAAKDTYEDQEPTELDVVVGMPLQPYEARYIYGATDETEKARRESVVLGWRLDWLKFSKSDRTR